MLDTLRTLPRAVRYKLRGQSYWIALYTDRDPIYEWDCEWYDLPRAGLKELRIVCPNGQVGVLGKAGGGDRVLQFKDAVAASEPIGRRTLAHVIGMLEDPHLPAGLATFFVWDYKERRLIGPVLDNVYSMQVYGPDETPF